MAYQDLEVTIADYIATITMNRPKAMNALNSNVLTELDTAINKLGADDQVRVIIITGGGKAFVAGADIKEMNELNLIDFRSFIARGQKAMYAIDLCEKPVIAAVNGFALGGGCELALACDFRLASEKAKFGFPEVNLGLFPGFGGTQRAPRFIGRGMASELTFTGAMIDAAEALRIGLVNHVYPADDLMEEAMKIAKTIASKAPIAVARSKTAIKMAGDTTLEAGLAFEREAMALVFPTKDRAEGMDAFINKRKAEFKGE
ncbi:MAG: enoyl-CoA hydratase/isomerase family protein [Desulfatibacillum sp.]|nr:enoyl-CoA hydratase/isomerase family protein [Desulfatibacillum sp.]